MNTILPTTLVGSYPQPDWLIDRGKLGKYVPEFAPRSFGGSAMNGWIRPRTTRRFSRSATRKSPESTS